MTERTCANCQTQDTPMWRRHPITGDSLCNPCGMYVRKYRRDRPPTGRMTMGYFETSQIRFIGSLFEGQGLEFNDEDCLWPKLTEEPSKLSPVHNCFICEIEVSDETEYYEHLVHHAYTPCSVYIERLDLGDTNMFDQNGSGADDDDADSVKTELAWPNKNDDASSVKTELADKDDGNSPVNSQGSVATLPDVASSGSATPTPPGIRVKTLKDLMPTAVEQKHTTSAVQRLTQQVERLPQTVTISPSVQISKRPAPPDINRGPNRKIPRLPESISLTPAKPTPSPIAPRLNPPMMNRMPPGRGGPPMGNPQSMRGPNQQSRQQSFPGTNSVSIHPPRKSGPPGQPQSAQQRGHPELRRTLSRPSSLTCQICDRSFSTQEMLQRHMSTSHRNAPSNPQMRSPQQNGPFPCNFCRVIYSTEAALNTHKQRIHAAEMNASQTANRGGAFRGPAPPELALPIVDVSHRLTKQRLTEKGVKYVVRLKNLTNSARTARFAIPVVPVEQASNTAYSRVASTAAANIIPLGPLTAVKQ